jgi:hypothetical protein
MFVSIYFASVIPCGVRGLVSAVPPSKDSYQLRIVSRNPKEPAKTQRWDVEPSIIIKKKIDSSL